MTDNYAMLAETYDIMVDWPARLARERPFFATLFETIRAKRVLDVGCGTGHHARMFSEFVPEVLGIDPSQPMLDRALAQTEGDMPQFMLGGFTDIPTLPGPFDVITMLGNTLAHVKNVQTLEKTLHDVRVALAPEGRLCIQTINYDSLLVAGSRMLPLVARTVEGREYLFLREHRIANRHAEFTITTLIKDAAWKQHIERTVHIPLTSEQMQASLDNAGFRNADFFGDYHGAEYDPASSGSMVVVAW
jgi:SAM-dependent methyltransferase